VGQDAATRLVRYDDPREVLQVDLVHDTRVRRHDAEVSERVLSPAKERVTLLVSIELQLGVQLEGVRPTEVVHMDRVIDDELDRLERIDLARVAAQTQAGV